MTHIIGILTAQVSLMPMRSPVFCYDKMMDYAWSSWSSSSKSIIIPQLMAVSSPSLK
jgi:hypothetical protein